MRVFKGRLLADVNVYIGRPRNGIVMNGIFSGWVVHQITGGDFLLARQPNLTVPAMDSWLQENNVSLVVHPTYCSDYFWDPETQVRERPFGFSSIPV